MEQLMYMGSKYDIDQVLSVPRLCNAVPKDVVNAQIEKAVEIASPTEVTDIAKTYCSAI